MNIVETKMLHRHREATAYSAQGYAAPQSGMQGLSFDYIFDFVRRRLWLLLFSMLLTTILGVTYFFAAPPSFTAYATLSIDMRRFQLFQGPSNLGEQLIDSAAALQSQLEVLRSESIALKVISDLRLAHDPDFGLATGIPIISSLVERRHPESENWRTRNAYRTLATSLRVKRLGIAYVIEISFDAAKPERAAQVANAIAEAYIATQLEIKYRATREGSNYLEGRIKELRNQVADAQKAVIDYKASNQIVDSGHGRLLTEQQLTEMNGQLTIARTRTSEARARVDRINLILKEDTILKGELSDAKVVHAAISDILSNQVITKLRTQYLEAANRESEWSEKYGRNHLAAVNLRNNMRTIRSSIRSELQRIEDAYKNDYEIASEREKSAEIQLQQAIAQSQDTNEAKVPLRELEASVQVYKTLHDNFLRRYSEAIEQQSFPYPEARLITRATAPSQRTYRRTLLIVAAMPFVGLFFGVGIGALRDFLDRGFRTSTQVETLLNTNCLVLMPKLESEIPDQDHILKIPKQGDILKPKDDQAKKPATARSTASSEARLISRDQSVTWTVFDQPFSRFAEAIRVVKLAADLNKLAASNKVIGMTSSVPGEGKSTISAALAQSITQIGMRVLLVDCDLRNPSLSRAIAPDATHGILEVLSEKASLEDTIWTHPSSGLTFLPAVSKLRMFPSSEILASLSTRKLFEKLRSSYDYVIVDLPPLAPIVDVRATTHLIDSYIFVVEWGRTPIAVVQHALGRAPQVHEKLLGAILNKVDMKLLRLYDGDRAGYYHDKSYGRYGYDN